jgi:hypothetical protein
MIEFKATDEWYENAAKIEEMAEIEEWLSNRPSATMDPCYDEVLVKRSRLRELKSRSRKERLPSKMMDSQQVVE